MTRVVLDGPIVNLPSPLGLYSHATAADPGQSLLWVSGQLAIDSSGNEVGADDFRQQLGQVFQNLGSVLAAADCTFENVLKFTTYLVRTEDIPTFYDERIKLFRSLYPEGRYPGNTLLVVQALTGPRFLVEIEAVAIMKRRSQ